MRTTLDIEKPILDDLKKLQKIERKPLGQIPSALMATALKQQQAAPARSRPDAFNWFTTNMGARVDIADKEALYRALGEQ